MNKPFQCGLVVGKFSPLHRGHELLIDHALHACDEVIVISYTKPEFTGCDRATREQWLEHRFPTTTRLVLDDSFMAPLCEARGIEHGPVIPHNDAPEYEHREFVGWLCRAILGQRIDAVFTSESYGDGFADALTAYFRTHAQSAIPVRHICVDKARAAVPISATQIRCDPHGYREFLAPEVYAHFVQRVCILGSESSGKTTLAQALATRLGTNWVAEYGRELWDRQNGVLHFEDMLRLALVQIERELKLRAQANRWLFCDTSPLTTLFYSGEMFNRVDPRLQHLAERRYDRVFLCAPDFAFVQDGTRRGESFRMRQHEWYLKELTTRKISFRLLEGPVSDRLAAAICEL